MNTSEFRTCQIVLYTGTVDSCHSAIHAAVTGPGHNSVYDIPVWHGLAYHTIIDSVESICRDTTYTQYMLIQKNLSKSQKRYTYKPL